MVPDVERYLARHSSSEINSRVVWGRCEPFGFSSALQTCECAGCRREQGGSRTSRSIFSERFWISMEMWVCQKMVSEGVSA